jgi:hypothetical protein
MVTFADISCSFMDPCTSYECRPALTVKFQRPLLPTHGGEEDTHDFSEVVCLVDYYAFSLINTIDALCEDPVAVHFVPPCFPLVNCQGVSVLAPTAAQFIT